ncbi:MAG: efflux RND transporter permease subunit [Gammaproteobacteria bacterium]
MNENSQPIDEDTFNSSDEGLNKSVHSPITFVLFIGILILGIVSYLSIPSGLDKTKTPPIVDIDVSYPGASSEILSSLVVAPLERSFSHIEGIKQISSISDKNRAIITLELGEARNTQEVLSIIHKNIAKASDLLPKGAMITNTEVSDASESPFAILTLFSNSLDDAQLRTIALGSLVSFEALGGISKGVVTGGRQSAFHVDISPTRLASFDISLMMVLKAIRSANGSGNVGDIEYDGNQIDIYAGDFFRGTEDIANIVLTTINGTPVTVRDVASVRFDVKNTSQMVSHFSKETALGAQAVTIALYQDLGVERASLNERLKAQIASIRAETPSNQVSIVLTRNTLSLAHEMTQFWLTKLLIFIGLIALSVLLTLGFRRLLVFSFLMAIPLSVSLTFANLIGLELSRVSIIGLMISIALCSGLITAQLLRSELKPGSQRSVGGLIQLVKESRKLISISAMVFILLICPLLLVDYHSVVNGYFFPLLVINLTFIVSSVIASLYFLPYFSLKLIDIDHLGGFSLKKKLTDWLLSYFYPARLYGRLLLFILIGATVFSLILLATQKAPINMMSADDSNEFGLIVSMPDGDALPITATVLNAMALKLQKIAEVKSINLYSGTISPSVNKTEVWRNILLESSDRGELHLFLSESSARSRTSEEIAKIALGLIQPIANSSGATVLVNNMLMAAPLSQSLVAEVYSEDDILRRQATRGLQQLISRNTLVETVHHFIRDEQPVINFKVDREKATYFGVSQEAIKQSLLLAMSSAKVTSVYLKNAIEPTDIIMSIPLSKRSQLGYLSQLPVPSSHGSMIPLSELGMFVYAKNDDLIFHKNLKEVEYLSTQIKGAEIASSALSTIENSIDDLLNNNAMLNEVFQNSNDSFNDISLSWSGIWAETKETLKNYAIAFASSIIAIFMLLLWRYGNFRITCVILAPIALLLIGIVPAHWLLGVSVSASSLLAFVVLSALGIHGSLCSLHHASKHYASGMGLFDAVIAANRAQLRLSVVTLISFLSLGALVFNDPIFAGMGVSFLFGIVVVIFVNIIVVPLGTLSAGELAWQSIRIDKPNIGTETKDCIVEEVHDQADNHPQMNTSQETASQKSSRIDTRVFLKKEDKSKL